MNNPNILMVTTQEIVNFQVDGGKKISYRNYKLLKDVFGESHVFLCMLDKYKRKNKWEENVVRIRTHHNKLERSINLLLGFLFHGKNSSKMILEIIRSKHIDILFLDRSLHGELIKEVDSRDFKCKIWVFVHNVEVDYFKNKYRNMRIIRSFLSGIVERNEDVTLKRADCILGLTERDREGLDKRYERKMKYIIPSTFDDVFDANRIKEPANDMHLRLLFVGSLFGPNYEGISWFVDHVMKQFVKQDVELTIVGKGFEHKRRQLQRKNVRVIGTVDDTSDYYYQSHIVVLPVFYGAGQKVKTLEAMMYGKTILATDESLTGYEVEGINGIYRCNTANDYINVIMSYARKETRSFICEDVRKLFLDKYSYQAVLETCQNTLRSEASI